MPKKRTTKKGGAIEMEINEIKKKKDKKEEAKPKTKKELIDYIKNIDIKVPYDKQSKLTKKIIDDIEDGTSNTAFSKNNIPPFDTMPYEGGTGMTKKISFETKKGGVKKNRKEFLNTAIALIPNINNSELEQIFDIDLETKPKETKPKPVKGVVDKKKKKLKGFSEDKMKILGNSITSSNLDKDDYSEIARGRLGYKGDDNGYIPRFRAKNKWKLEIKSPMSGDIEETYYFPTLSQIASRVPMFSYDTWRNIAIGGRSKTYDKFVNLTKI